MLFGLLFRTVASYTYINCLIKCWPGYVSNGPKHFGQNVGLDAAVRKVRLMQRKSSQQARQGVIIK